MAVKLSRHAFEHAKQFIDAGKVVFDERDAWSEHQPSSQQENDFIERHGFEEYGNGIWASTTRSRKTPKGGTSSPTAISTMFTAVA